MTTEVAVQDQMDLIQYKRTLPDEDIRRRIIIFQLTDDWATDISSGELRKNYAQILRSQLSRLSQYYAEADQAGRAQLAAILHDATFFAEHEGLSLDQISVLQFALTYFQRIALTQDELRECTMKLYRSGIEVIPPMPDFAEFPGHVVTGIKDDTLPIYYLDTTIQLSKLFAPQPMRANIQHRITQQRCVVSHYVRMEYLRWLEPCVHLDQLLKEEAERNHATAISEVQARILLQYGRQQNKLFSILTWLVRYHNSQDTHGVLASLKNLIENNLHLFFAENVEELPDPIACPLMDLKGVPHGTSYRLKPDLPYRRGEMPCHIVDFLQKHRLALQELAPALHEAYPKMADACRRVLANPADAQGNLCKTLGDVIIALQTPAAAVLWSTDAAYDVICPTLGIAHVREPITTQTS